MNIKVSHIVLISFACIVIGMGVVTCIGGYNKVIPNGKLANSLIEQCQKDLPRDQYCTIIAVVEEETEEG